MQFFGNSENEMRVSTELAREGDSIAVPFPSRASDRGRDATLKLPISSLTGQVSLAPQKSGCGM